MEAVLIAAFLPAAWMYSIAMIWKAFAVAPVVERMERLMERMEERECN